MPQYSLYHRLIPYTTLDRALQVAWDNPEATKFILGEAIEYKVNNYTSYEVGTMVGRGASSFILAPLGIASGIGDFLTGVENYGATVDTALDYILLGGPQ